MTNSDWSHQAAWLVALVALALGLMLWLALEPLFVSPAPQHEFAVDQIGRQMLDDLTGSGPAAHPFAIPGLPYWPAEEPGIAPPLLDLKASSA